MQRLAAEKEFRLIALGSYIFADLSNLYTVMDGGVCGDVAMARKQIADYIDDNAEITLDTLYDGIELAGSLAAILGECDDDDALEVAADLEDIERAYSRADV